MDSNKIVPFGTLLCDAMRSHPLKACGGNALFLLLESQPHYPPRTQTWHEKQVNVVRLGFALKRILLVLVSPKPTSFS